jgi:hypothetical protein
MTRPDEDTCQPMPAGLTPSGKPAFRHGDACGLYPGKMIGPAHPWHHDPEDLPPPSCTEGHRKCSPVMRNLTAYSSATGEPAYWPGYYHADDCPASPGERIDLKEYAKGRRMPRGWRGTR